MLNLLRSSTALSAIANVGTACGGVSPVAYRLWGSTTAGSGKGALPIWGTERDDFGRYITDQAKTAKSARHGRPHG